MRFQMPLNESLDESVASVLQYMGILGFRDELDRAHQLFDEFIRIRQDNGTEPDGDYVNVLFMIGNIHKMQGHEEEAQRCKIQPTDCRSHGQPSERR